MESHYMDDPLIIFVDRLKAGDAHIIRASTSSAFFDIHEADLTFEDPVIVDGQAYIAEDELVLHITASTYAKMPCTICQEPTAVPLTIKDYYHAEPLKQISQARFDIRTILRDALLLELPKVAECQNSCPERKNMEFFLHQPQEGTEAHYFPFNNINLS